MQYTSEKPMILCSFWNANSFNDLSIVYLNLISKI
nr:MAG TPA: hypothetical protein [Caudoviricetes sp.]